MSFRIEILSVQQLYQHLPFERSRCGVSLPMEKWGYQNPTKTLPSLTYVDEEGKGVSIVTRKTSSSFDKTQFVESSKVLFDRSWESRIQLVEEVFKNSTIFSLSIIPVDEHKKQTIYVKRVAVGAPTTNTFQGFIKPFTFYANNEFKPSFELKNLPKEFVPYSLSDLNQLPEHLQPLAERFKNDPHALSIALQVLNPLEKRIDKLYIYKDL